MTLPGSRSEWIIHAACRGVDDPDALFFADHTPGQRQAVRICLRCPVAIQCAVDALDHNIQYGVYGGLTAAERRRLRRRRRDGDCWTDLLRTNA